MSSSQGWRRDATPVQRDRPARLARAGPDRALAAETTRRTRCPTAARVGSGPVRADSPWTRRAARTAPGRCRGQARSSGSRTRKTARTNAARRPARAAHRRSRRADAPGPIRTANCLLAANPRTPRHSAPRCPAGSPIPDASALDRTRHGWARSPDAFARSGGAAVRWRSIRRRWPSRLHPARANLLVMQAPSRRVVVAAPVRCPAPPR